MPRILLVFALVLYAGCAANEEGPLEASDGDANTEIQPSLGVFEPRDIKPQDVSAETEDFYQKRIDTIANLLLRRDHEGALELLRDTMASDPPEPFGHRLRSLEFRALNKLFTETWIDAFARFEKPAYEIGEVLKGEIVLMNISDGDLVVPAQRLMTQLGQDEPVVTKTIFRSVTTYREYIPDNTLVINADTRNFSIDQDIVLARGEAHRIPVAIDSMNVNPQATMLRSYTLECKLHAARVEVGGEVFHSPVIFRPATARVYPRGAEHLQDAPFERVKQAWDRESPVHMSLASSWVPRTQRRELLSFFRGHLVRPETIEAMKKAVMSCLQVLADDDESRNEGQWIAWIDRQP
ncbi:MAG: hypothetical protein KDB53_06285 [Planctomycetes bacterium]|nr:hypothetical protein [Planctomycetota bacterium]